MDVHTKLQLLGGLTAQQFMTRHWQKKPLLVRGAVDTGAMAIDRSSVLALAAREDIESRLVQQKGTDTQAGWTVRDGPIPRRSLPPLSRSGWTLLVQGVDSYLSEAHAMLQQFRFVPDARLDDLMVSYATDGGGVGPHFDSYDVFLLQAHGQRRWRIGRQSQLDLRSDTPLKVLARFEPEDEYLLEPGDMLYLPPRYAHEGVAVGECMTWSVGFRAPGRDELVRELLGRVADEPDDADPASEVLYRDPRQAAVACPGAIPTELHNFAHDALLRALARPDAVSRALGEYLTEPKPNVWFDAETMRADLPEACAVALDRRTRMAYDDRHIFINGESYRAAGRDAKLMHRLADDRSLDAKAFGQVSNEARALISDWHAAGWLHEE